MAITFRTAQNGTGSPTAVITKPTGTVDGDILFGCFVSSGAVTTPTGWTLIRSTSFNSAVNVLATYWKVAAGEGASYSVTGTTTIAGVIGAFTGLASWGQDAEGGQANSASTSVTAPAVVTTIADDLLLWAGASHAGGTIGGPSGMTVPTNGTAGSTDTIGLAYLLDQVATGSTGTKVGTATLSANAGHLVAFNIVPSPFPLPLSPRMQIQQLTHVRL